MKRKIKKAPYKKKATKKVVTYKPRRMRMTSSIPFPKVKYCKLVYKNPSSVFSTPGAIQDYNSLRIICNALYDFDYSNYFGDKQPLYFDQLCSAVGPYTNYKVTAWKTTIKLINASSKILNVYFDPASTLVTDTDTPVELKNRPAVQYRQITASANAQPSCTFSYYNSLRRFFGKNQTSDITLTGDYSSNPSTPIYAALMIQNADGSVAQSDVLMSVTHTFYCQFFNRDATAS